MSAATGARRGEVLALRWSDIQDGRAIIARSLTQTKHVLEFKGTKTERPRPVSIPAGKLVALEGHPKAPDEVSPTIGPDYPRDRHFVFANPDWSALQRHSGSTSVSVLFR